MKLSKLIGKEIINNSNVKPDAIVAAVIARLHECVKPLEWERDDDLPSIADAVGAGNLYRVITRHDGKGSLRINRMNQEHSEYEHPAAAEAAAQAHCAAQIIEGLDL